MLHLGNLIVTNEKFVLFQDHHNLERESVKIMLNILQSQNETKIVTDVIPDQEISLSVNYGTLPSLNLPSEKSTVILPSASSLFQQYPASEIFKMFQQLKRSPNVKQVYLWMTLANFRETDYVPNFVEHMADIVVNLQSGTGLGLLIKKVTGKVTKNMYHYEIKDHFMVKAVEKKKTGVVEAPKVKPESLGTFKIELSEKDKIARENLVLPFEKHLKVEDTTNNSGGKIIYDLDKDDDFDEEDPDDDLDV